MSLGIGIKGTDGIVLAAESRVTLTTTDEKGQNAQHYTFDNATKLLSFREPNNFIGAVTYGTATIGQRTAHSFIPELESELLAVNKERLSVKEFSQILSDFFLKQWNLAYGPGKNPVPQADMTFVIGGFNDDEPYGRIFDLSIPNSPTPREIYEEEDNFGIIWGGQRAIVDRLLQGYDSNLLSIIQTELKLQPEQIEALRMKFAQLQMPVPVNSLALQDCVDLAILFIRTTIESQKLSIELRGCGGPIDVAVITRNDGLRFINKKDIKI